MNDPVISFRYGEKLFIFEFSGQDILMKDTHGKHLLVFEHKANRMDVRNTHGVIGTITIDRHMCHYIDFQNGTRHFLGPVGIGFVVNFVARHYLDQQREYDE